MLARCVRVYCSLSTLTCLLAPLISYQHWATQPRQWLNKIPTLLGNLHLTQSAEASTAILGTNFQPSFPMSLFHTFLFMFLAENKDNLDQLIYIIPFHLLISPCLTRAPQQPASVNRRRCSWKSWCDHPKLRSCTPFSGADVIYSDELVLDRRCPEWTKTRLGGIKCAGKRRNDLT